MGLLQGCECKTILQTCCDTLRTLSVHMEHNAANHTLKVDDLARMRELRVLDICGGESICIEARTTASVGGELPLTELKFHNTSIVANSPAALTE